MKLIYSQHKFQEGDVFYKWAINRIGNNKNVIVATTGPTGSGKSLNDLRKAEIIYERKFNSKFPIENCCFSVAELMKRISSGTLKKGEVIILEEAGVNAGSADWQNKIVKMFNYVLQAFRSMNIILFMNLPVLTMLSKQARQLVHMHMETQGINFSDGTVNIKPLYHQLNQHSGKSYWKYLKVRQGKRAVKVQRMTFSLPSAELREKYEAKKAKFLADMTTDFTKDLEIAEKDKLNKQARKDLAPRQLEVFNLLKQGLNQRQAAIQLDLTEATVSEHVKAILKKGYLIEKVEAPLITKVT